EAAPRAPQHRRLPAAAGGGDHRPAAGPAAGPAHGRGGRRDPGRAERAMTPMTAAEFRSLLAERTLVADGAMGAMLHAAGNALDQALPPISLSDPALVRAVHDSYVDDGVDIIQTNTFGASRLRLAEHGLAEKTEEINHSAARIAREAAAGGRILVAGSVAPAVSVHQRRRIGRAARADARRAQITAQIGRASCTARGTIQSVGAAAVR